MASLIHSLSVLLKLDVGGFKKSVRSAEHTLRGFGKGLLAAGGGIGAVAVFNKIGHAMENLNKERGGLKHAADSVVALRTAWKDLVTGVLQRAEPHIVRLTNVMVNLAHGLESVLEVVGPIGIQFLKWSGIAAVVLALYASIVKLVQAMRKLFAISAAMAGLAGGGPMGAIAAALGAVALIVSVESALNALDRADTGIQPIAAKPDAAQVAATKAGDGLIAGLDKQIATFWMTARQADIYTASLAGASGAQLDLARALDVRLSAMEDDKEAVANSEKALSALADQYLDLALEIKNFGKSSSDILADTFDSEGFSITAKRVRLMADELRNLVEGARLDDLGKSIHRNMMTPLEKWTEKLAEMALLFESGRLGAEDYARALEKMREEASPEQEQGAVQFAGLASAQELGGISKIGSQSFGGSIANRQVSEQQKTNQLLQTIDMELKKIRIDGGLG